jgi:hypothetical protein
MFSNTNIKTMSKRFPSSKPPHPPPLNPLVNQPPSTPFGLPQPRAVIPPPFLPTPSYPNGWPNTNRPTPLQPPPFAPNIPLPPNPDSGHPHPNSFNGES